MTAVHKLWTGLLTLIMMLSVNQGLAEDRPILRWYRMHFAPIFILTGEMRDQGFGDALLRALAAKLPQYQHQVIDAPLERSLEKSGEGRELICSSFLLQSPERQARMYFSDPLFRTPPNGAVIRASDRSRFAPFLKDGRLLLGNVLQTQKFAVGITRNRSYGRSIDALLAPHANQPYLVAKSGQGIGAIILSDLSAQRGVDLAIAYPVEAAYWLKTSLSPIPLYFLPVAEAAGYEEPRVGCSRTPQGEAVIAAINALLADPAFRQEYLRVYVTWWEQLADRLPGAPATLENLDISR